MKENIEIRINRSSSVLITSTDLHYKFGVVNETEKIIPLKGIKNLNYNPPSINKNATGCNIFAGVFAGFFSGFADPGNVETNLPVLSIEYYPPENKWPKILKIVQPDLSQETADMIIAAVKK